MAGLNLYQPSPPITRADLQGHLAAERGNSPSRIPPQPPACGFFQIDGSRSSGEAAAVTDPVTGSASSNSPSCTSRISSRAGHAEANPIAARLVRLWRLDLIGVALKLALGRPSLLDVEDASGFGLAKLRPGR